MIKHKVSGVILKSGVVSCRIPVTVEFVYDPSDPLAVEIIFDWTDDDGDGASTIWTVARGLLVVGCASPMAYGSGDFRLRLDRASDTVITCMKTPEGHADVGIDAQGLINFLDATTAAVRLGDECLDSAIDEALKEILGS